MLVKCLCWRIRTSLLEFVLRGLKFGPHRSANSVPVGILLCPPLYCEEFTHLDLIL